MHDFKAELLFCKEAIKYVLYIFLVSFISLILNNNVIYSFYGVAYKIKLLDVPKTIQLKPF